MSGIMAGGGQNPANSLCQSANCSKGTRGIAGGEKFRRQGSLGHVIITPKVRMRRADFLVLGGRRAGRNFWPIYRACFFLKLVLYDFENQISQRNI